MMRILRKSKHLSCFSCIALLLFSTLLPCACFANAPKPSLEANTSHDSSHCCEQDKEAKEKEGDCSDCAQCASISAYSVNTVVLPEAAHFRSLDISPALIFVLIVSAEADYSYIASTNDFGPPGIPITKSSSLAKQLHRWLV
jgi:hypothetical protein